MLAGEAEHWAHSAEEKSEALAGIGGSQAASWHLFALPMAKMLVNRCQRALNHLDAVPRSLARLARARRSNSRTAPWLRFIRWAMS